MHTKSTNYNLQRLLALESVRLSNGSNKKSLNFKVDFEKAFDSFRACLSSSWASILVNGSPTSEFSIKCGLKKGDPLSHFLFIHVMEGLHNALSTAVSSGLIRGVKFDSPEVFYLASGLKINIHKSNVSGIGVSDVDVFSMASNFGCASRSFPFTYLGLPIGSNMMALDVLHKNTLWVKVFKALHGPEGGFDNNGCIYNVRGDGVAGIKRRRRDLSGDGVRNLATASGHGRLKEDLESSTWRRRQDFKTTSSQRFSYIY
ncbi:hypothetical protein Tco_1515636 [Tanacetum coccineum]